MYVKACLGRLRLGRPWQCCCSALHCSILHGKVEEAMVLRGMTKSGHGWTEPGRAVHGRNVMVRQLRVAQSRVRTYRFLTGEGSAALLKNGQCRTDRAGHRRAIFRITRNSKDIDIALAKLTLSETYVNATRSNCMLKY